MTKDTITKKERKTIATKMEEAAIQHFIENSKEFYLDICKAAEAKSNRRALNKFEAFVGARVFIETLFMLDGISDEQKESLEAVVKESVSKFKKEKKSSKAVVNER